MVLPKTKRQAKKVVVAMSGGVDSSVAAALLKKQGWEVSGLTMTLRLPGLGVRRIFSERLAQARRVADQLQIPHRTVDLGADFRRQVVEDFIREYLNARTPNPCVQCNRGIKFGLLLDAALESGADVLATGHYARLVYNRKQDRYDLKKARDRDKDQSYFLYPLRPDILSRLVFPLGDCLKPDVRRLARRFGLSRTVVQKESQDICFIPAGGYKAFIRKAIGPQAIKPGFFKDHTGRIVGEHLGIIHYTIGQRDKLGLALGYPAYVFRIDKKSNTVHVGPRECLRTAGLIAEKCYCFIPFGPGGSFRADVRIRYHAHAVRATLTPLPGGKVRVMFQKPQSAVTPGQSAVFYRGDRLLGGGLISRPIPISARA